MDEFSEKEAMTQENGSGQTRPAVRIKWLTWTVAFGWSLLLFGLVTWDIHIMKETTREISIREARANFDKDQAFRYWAASHGGVYVPVDEKTPPNPYLAHIPERDIMTPSGRPLTLMNPAYMVRQLNEFFSERYGISGHITSLKPLRPENAPDEWEKKALLAFEEGEKEVVWFGDLEGKPVVRLMQPMIATKDCLMCHAHQGYKAGDIRGGVSVTLPIADHYAEQLEKNKSEILTHSVIWLLGILGIFFSSGRLKRYLAQRDASERALQAERDKLKTILETIQDGIYIVSRDYEIEYVNPAVERTFGPLSQKKCYDYFHGKDEACPWCVNEKVFAGESVRWEFFHEQSGKYFELFDAPLRNADGSFSKFELIHDITDIRTSEKVIRESEERMNRGQEVGKVGTWDWDPKSGELHWSDETYRLHGFEPGEVTPTYELFLSMVHPDDQGVLNEAVQKAIEGKADYNIDCRLIRKDGCEIAANAQGRVIFDETGAPVKMLGTFQDITLRKRSERALAESEERFRQLAENIEEVFWLTAWDENRVIYVSPSFETIWGKPREALYKDPMEWTSSIHPDDRKRVETLFSGMVETGGFDTEFRIIQPGGGVRWIHDRGYPVRDEKGDVYRIAGIARDITERRQLEETLEFAAKRAWKSNGENFFEALVLYLARILEIDYAFIGKRLEGEKVQTLALYAGGGLAPNIEYDLKGTPCENVVGKTACCHPEGVQQSFPEDRMLVEMEAESYIGVPLFGGDGASLGLVAVLGKRPMGNWRFVETILRAVAARVAGEMERSAAEEVLKESEGRLREAQHISNIGHWVLDPSSGSVEGSDELFRIFGLTKESTTLDAFAAVVHPEDREYDLRHIRKGIETGEAWDIEHRLLMHDGVVKWIRAIGTPRRDAAGKVIRVIGIVQDITEKKLAEEKIREAGATFEALVSASPVAIVAIDTEGIVFLWNRSAELLFGWKEKELLGRKSPIVPEGMEGEFLALTNAVRMGKVLRGVEVKRLRKDGSLVDVSLSTAPLFHASGEMKGAMALFVDISERKAVETETLRAKQAAEEASLAKSDFLSRMSHELRTPLNSILGFVQILDAKRDELDERTQICVEEIEAAGWHLTHLVDDVLDITRIESGRLELNPVPIELPKIMEECLAMIAPQVEEKKIAVDYNRELCIKSRTIADPVRVKEIFLNLLSNAVKYNVESGRVSIACEQTEAGTLKVRIVNTGTPISEEDRKNLFVPFSRLAGQDPATQGIGIGLTISKYLVELMGGRIGFEPGDEGNTFWVELPLENGEKA